MSANTQGVIHKSRSQIFRYFWPPPPFTVTFTKEGLCNQMAIWLAPPPQLSTWFMDVPQCSHFSHWLIIIFLSFLGKVHLKWVMYLHWISGCVLVLSSYFLLYWNTLLYYGKTLKIFKLPNSSNLIGRFSKSFSRATNMVS